MSEKKCAIDGCGGRAVQTGNLFLHTLGSDPKTKPDFGEFIECLVWRCNKCGNIQLYSYEEIIKVPSAD